MDLESIYEDRLMALDRIKTLSKRWLDPTKASQTQVFCWRWISLENILLVGIKDHKFEKRFPNWKGFFMINKAYD